MGGPCAARLGAGRACGHEPASGMARLDLYCCQFRRNIGPAGIAVAAAFGVRFFTGNIPAIQPKITPLVWRVPSGAGHSACRRPLDIKPA